MEKNITIDGKKVRLKVTGATPLRYKSQFGKDYFVEILKLNALHQLKDVSNANLDGVDFEVVFNIIWTMAKTADPDIPDPITWLDDFEEFPVLEIFPEIQDMLIATLQSKKKKELTQKKAKN